MGTFPKVQVSLRNPLTGQRAEVKIRGPDHQEVSLRKIPRIFPPDTNLLAQFVNVVCSHPVQLITLSHGDLQLQISNDSFVFLDCFAPSDQIPDISFLILGEHQYVTSEVKS